MVENNKPDENEYIRAGLASLSPDQFDEFVRELWERRGYDLDENPEAAADGYDIIATKADPPHDKYLLEIEGEEAEILFNFIKDLHQEKWSEGRQDRRPEITGLYYITNRPVTKAAVQRTDPTSDVPLLVRLVTSSEPKEPHVIDLVELIDETGSRDWLRKYDLLPSPPLDETHELTVVVVTEAGEPVNDAVVTIRTGRRVFRDSGVEKHTGRTDKTGTASVELENGRYTVTVSHEDFEQTRLESLSVLDDTEVRLTLQEKTHTILITTTTETGEPVSNSLVTIRDENGSLVDAFNGITEGETSNDGEVEAEVPNGEYTITARHEEFTDEPTSNITISGASREVSVRFKKRKLYEVTITLEDENNDPVPGALVTVKNRNGDRPDVDGKIESETDRVGRTTVEVPNGQYRITAEQSDPVRSVERDIEIDGGSESISLSFARDDVVPSDLDTTWRKAIQADLVLLVVFGPLLLLDLLVRGAVEPSIVHLALFSLLWITVPFVTSINIRKAINIISWLLYPVLLLVLYTTIPPILTYVIVFLSWILLPVFIHLDSSEIRNRIGWPVYRFNYIVLSLIIGANIPIAYVYLRRRRKHLPEANEE